MLDRLRYTSRPIRPSGPSGSPPFSRVHVSPPSVDFQMPLPGPPPFMQQAFRTRWNVEANKMRGSVADITRSFAPVHSSTFSTVFQERPPSVVLYTPRSPPDPKSGPVAATSTTLLSFGSI